MESQSQYYQSILCSLLSSAHICPDEWLVDNKDCKDSLSCYFGLKFDEEFMQILIRGNLAFVKDDVFEFNWNKTSCDRSKYSFKQLIVDYNLPVELSETT